MKKNEWLWTEKYRPSTVDECILPKDIKEKFNSFIREKNIPNLILSGPSGVGKTSIALVCLKEMDADFLKINSSLERGIDVIRDKMTQFASTVSFKDGRKYILLDEADNMTEDAQEGLRAFMENYSSNCGFIFTCNNADKIINAIISRCDVISFQLKNEDFPELGKQFYNVLTNILDNEIITYQKSILVEIIKKFWPDWRKMITVIQVYSMNNKIIDSGILSLKKQYNLDILLPLLKKKSWRDMRKWVGENYIYLDSFSQFAKALMEELDKIVEENSFILLVDIQNQYDYQNYFVIDKQVNLVAFLSKIMSEIVYK